MSDTSVFTDYLKTLAAYSEKVDTGTASPDDYTEFQKLTPGLREAWENKDFSHTEFNALIDIYYFIKDRFREYLKLDRY